MVFTPFISWNTLEEMNELSLSSWMSLGVSNTPSVSCSWGIGTNLKSDSAPGRPGQVDFLARQVHISFSLAQSARTQATKEKRLTHCKQNLGAACPRQAGIEDFFESCNISNVPITELHNDMVTSTFTLLNISDSQTIWLIGTSLGLAVQNNMSTFDSESLCTCWVIGNAPQQIPVPYKQCLHHHHTNKQTQITNRTT